MTLPLSFLVTCQRAGILPTRFVLVTNVRTQTLHVFERNPTRRPVTLNACSPYCLQRKLRCSTSRFGTGQIEGSNQTPLGLHRIAEKIGGGWPAGTVFKSRQPIGFTWKGLPQATITTRILWLDGLEPGRNRGGNVDSHRRYIYIHGTGDEPGLGRPASCGCIHLAANDLIPLFDQIPAGTLVWIG